jgi:hypothetical protein
MVCRGLTNRALLLALTLLVASAHGQNAKAVLNLSDDEIRKFVETTVDQGFPENRADQMTMLVINKSAVVVPDLEARIEQMLMASPPQQKFVDIASEMIAYAGNEQSLEAISKLSAIDSKRFGKLIRRTLDNAMNYGNPFKLVYRAFNIGDDALAQSVTSWCDSALATDRMKRLWAQAMVDRYGTVPGSQEWAGDPLASRLPKAQKDQLQEAITRFAVEDRGRRLKQ